MPPIKRLRSYSSLVNCLTYSWLVDRSDDENLFILIETARIGS